MSSSRSVAVVGAGASGLAAARAMQDAGNSVVVFESQRGVGGVWSADREYPGLATQNTKASYSFSDAPMPAAWPEQATSAQMRAYLQEYAERHDLLGRIRFDTEVRSIARAGDRWRVEPAGADSVVVDAVVLASGVFSDPLVPDWPGRPAFEDAGGRVLLPADLDRCSTAGREVAVVGWGKTACDLAVALAPDAAGLTVVARSMRWKTPHRIGRLRLHETLMLSRAGDWLLYGSPARGSLVLHRASRVLPRILRSALALLISRHLGLPALGLHPDGRLSNVSSQITPGLLDAVRAGRIAVRRDTSITGLEGGARPAVRLSTGELLHVDDVLLGTGYRLRLDPLEADVLQRITGPDGVLRLRRFVHADAVPGLYLVGWTQNISGLLTAEIAALWAAAHLSGKLPPGSAAETSEVAAIAPVAVPASNLADLDELLRDLGHPLPLRARVAQWVSTMKAQHYTGILDAIRRDQRRAAPRDASQSLDRPASTGP